MYALYCQKQKTSMLKDNIYSIKYDK